MFSTVVILADICNSQQQTKDAKDYSEKKEHTIFFFLFLSLSHF